MPCYCPAILKLLSTIVFNFRSISLDKITHFENLWLSTERPIYCKLKKCYIAPSLTCSLQDKFVFRSAVNPSCRQSAIHLLLLADHLEEDHTAQVIHKKEDLKNRQQKDLQEKLLSGKQKKEKELVNT